MMILSRKHIVLLLLMAALSGCGITDWLFSSDKKKEEPVTPLFAFEPKVNADVAWSHRLGDQGDEILGLKMAPFVDGSTIYGANHDGDVVAIDAESGDERWEAEVDAPITSGVGAGGGLVVVGTQSGQVVVLDANDGSEKWRGQVTSEILGAPATDGRVVVVQSMDSRVQAFDAKSGTPRWSYASTRPVLTLRGTSSPVIVDGMTYMTFDSGKIAAVDTDTGIVQWEYQAIVPQGKGELERVIDTEGRPYVDGSDIFFASYQGAIVGLERTRGSMSWSEDASTQRAIAGDDGNVYLSDDKGVVYAFSQTSGREVWKNEQLKGRKLTGPAPLGDYVLVVDLEGYAHLLSQTDGEYAGRYSTGLGDMRNDPVSDGDIVYLLGNNGSLQAIRLEQ